MNQSLKNALQYRFGLLKHFVIPEADHAKTMPREILRALEVVEQRLVVLTSVYFEDQSRPQTYEICDIRS